MNNNLTVSKVIFSLTRVDFKVLRKSVPSVYIVASILLITFGCVVASAGDLVSRGSINSIDRLETIIQDKNLRSLMDKPMLMDS